MTPVRKASVRTVCGITLLLLIVLTACPGWKSDEWQEVPEKMLRWECASKGWLVWGASGDLVYGVSAQPDEQLSVCRWQHGAPERFYLAPLEDCLGIVMLPNNKWLARVFKSQEKHAYLYLGELEPGKAVDRRLQQYDGWTANLGNGSRNGKYATAWCEQRSGVFDKPDTVRFGLVAADGKTFDWITSVEKEQGLSAAVEVHRLIPSDDGKYIGVAGWNNGVMMIDVAKKKVAWEANWQHCPGTECPPKIKVPWKGVPFKENSTADLAFSPDSKIVYSGGGTGCVFGIKVETGEVVSKWWATLTNHEEYGYRISTVSVSPDGRFVAAGTGPEGHVYLFSRKDGKRCILNHGETCSILITSFSPDSKRLASFAAGQIKIWKLPEETVKPAAGTTELDKQTSAETQPSK